MKGLFAWIIVVLVFTALDAVWLSQVAPKLDPPLIGEVLSNTVKPIPAAAFYLLYTVGLVWLAVEPGRAQDVRRSALKGLLLGLVAYGCYDLTNQATLKVWDVRITLADMGWGGLISALAPAAAAAVLSRRPA